LFKKIASSQSPQPWISSVLLFPHPSRAKQGGSSEFSLWFSGKRRDIKCLSVTSFSAHTSGARWLKFGRNNHHIGGSKFMDQIFDILSIS